jgi:hypothetical protein
LALDRDVNKGDDRKADFLAIEYRAVGLDQSRLIQ